MFPDLRIIPIDSLHVPQVETNISLVYALAERISRDKVQKNPIIVSKLRDNYFLVLDGVRRVLALQDMGCKHVLAQIVDHDSDSVHINEWLYVLPNTTIFEVQERLSDLKGIDVSDVDNNHIATVHHPKGTLYINADEDDVLVLLPEIIRAFPDKRIIKIAKYHDLNRILEYYKGVLIDFIEVDKKKIISDILAGKKISLGIIRYSVDNRALMVNADLSLLKSRISLEDKNRILDDEIKRKRMSGGIRYYSGPVYIFNE